MFQCMPCAIPWVCNELCVVMYAVLPGGSAGFVCVCNVCLARHSCELSSTSVYFVHFLAFPCITGCQQLRTIDLHIMNCEAALGSDCLLHVARCTCSFCTLIYVNLVWVICICVCVCILFSCSARGSGAHAFAAGMVLCFSAIVCSIIRVNLDVWCEVGAVQGACVRIHLRKIEGLRVK